MTEKQTRIFVWSWPRSISTAFEKCLSFVDGVQIWHEPFITAFNGEFMTRGSLTEEQGPFSEMLKQYTDMVTSMKDTPNEFTGGKFMPVEQFTYPFVKAKLEEEEPGKKYIVIKDMAPAVLDHLDQLPDVPTRHTFLIRHPYRFLLSQRKTFLGVSSHQGDPDDFDMFKSSPIIESFYGKDAMLLLWKHVLENGKDPSPIIIDAEDVINHPHKILPKYFEALGIPFNEKYITWDASEESLKTWKGAMEHVVIGKRFGYFGKAFQSSCFMPNTHATPTKNDLTPDIMKSCEYLLPGYEEMYEHRLKPE